MNFESVFDEAQIFVGDASEADIQAIGKALEDNLVRRLFVHVLCKNFEAYCLIWQGISKNTSLRILDLEIETSNPSCKCRFCAFPEICAQMFSFRDHPTLETIYVEVTGLMDDPMFKLGSAMSACVQLKKVELHTNFHGAEIHHFFAGLKDVRQLKTLKLHLAMTSYSDGSGFFDFFKSTKTLEDLVIRDTGTSIVPPKKIWEKLGMILKDNATISSIELYGQRGCSSMFVHMIGNTTLRRCIIGASMVTSDQIIDICMCLRTNPHLEYIDVEADFKRESWKVFWSAMLRIPGLRVLSLQDTSDESELYVSKKIGVLMRERLERFYLLADALDSAPAADLTRFIVQQLAYVRRLHMLIVPFADLSHTMNGVMRAVEQNRRIACIDFQTSGVLKSDRRLLKAKLELNIFPDHDSVMSATSHVMKKLGISTGVASALLETLHVARKRKAEPLVEDAETKSRKKTRFWY